MSQIASSESLAAVMPPKSIAAKTMARFKNLEDRDFAEYFLVGTFLSLVTAGAIALLTKLLLA